MAKILHGCPAYLVPLEEKGAYCTTALFMCQSEPTGVPILALKNEGFPCFNLYKDTVWLSRSPDLEEF